MACTPFKRYLRVKRPQTIHGLHPPLSDTLRVKRSCWPLNNPYEGCKSCWPFQQPLRGVQVLSAFKQPLRGVQVLLPFKQPLRVDGFGYHPEALQATPYEDVEHARKVLLKRVVQSQKRS